MKRYYCLCIILFLQPLAILAMTSDEKTHEFWRRNNLPSPYTWQNLPDGLDLTAGIEKIVATATAAEIRIMVESLAFDAPPDVLESLKATLTGKSQTIALAGALFKARLRPVPIDELHTLAHELKLRLKALGPEELELEAILAVRLVDCTESPEHLPYMLELYSRTGNDDKFELFVNCFRAFLGRSKLGTRSDTDVITVTRDELIRAVKTFESKLPAMQSAGKSGDVAVPAYRLRAREAIAELRTLPNAVSISPTKSQLERNTISRSRGALPGHGEGVISF